MKVILQEEFRQLVRAAIVEQAITQSELARRMGVNRTTVSQYLSGKTVPGVDMVEKFFTALGLQPHLSVSARKEKIPA